jgi:hypothetical protein
LHVPPHSADEQIGRGPSAEYAHVEAATPARGWHPDPSDEKRERWHDGRDFTKHTHRALRRPTFLGAAYDRSMWPGANADARKAQHASTVSSVFFLVAIVGFVSSLAVPWLLNILGVIMLLFAASATVQVMLALRGIRRSAIDGALAVAITTLVQGSLYALISFGYLVTRVVLAISG